MVSLGSKGDFIWVFPEFVFVCGGHMFHIWDLHVGEWRLRYYCGGLV